MLDNPKNTTQVLILEDSFFDIELYKYFLQKDRRQQHQVSIEKTGKDGLSKLKSYKPDCILLDYQLPDMSGIEFLKKIKHSLEIPVVMITGHGNEQIAISAIQNGAQEYLKKGSFGPYDLIVSIQKAIETVKMTKKINEQQQDLERRASFDFLTGLHNRSTFLTYLDQILSTDEIRSGYKKAALVFIDLDRFKSINDTYTHIIGDKYLIEIASRIKISIRPDDLLARIGGDEFTACLLDIENKDKALSVVKRIEKNLQPPLSIEGNILYPSASIGISITGLRYHSPKDLLKDADISMYESKKRGGGKSTLFIPGMRQKINGRTKIENDLKQAVMKRELEDYYQPIISLETGRVEGIEALIRWWHRKHNCFIPPNEFIPIAEKSSLINKIGDFILKESCRRLQMCHELGFKIFLSFNISPKELESTQIVSNILNTINQYSVPPQYFKAEITENCLIQNKAMTLPKLEGLVDHGVQLALDDFGAGYSSIGYLKDFPFHCVKIDRSLTKDIARNENSKKLLGGIIFLLHSLQFEVAIEGIEDQDQLDIIKNFKPKYVQGYFLGKPMPFKEIKCLLKETSQAQDSLCLASSK